MIGKATELSPNIFFGPVLQKMLPMCVVRSENTGVIVEDASLQPDILITGPDRAPVVIEAEYIPARDVETEAVGRLGLTDIRDNKRIETAVAVVYPCSLKTAPDIEKELIQSALRYAIFHLDGTRFPNSGWLEGTCEDIAEVVRLSHVPKSAVNEAAQRLELGIDTAAKRLDEISELSPSIAESIARLLGLTNVIQTRRMACAIVANAMVFHDRVAGMHATVKPLHLVCGDDVINPQAELASAWDEILKINYWPIFAVARDIVNQLLPSDCRRILRVLQQTAHDVSSTGVNMSHDLTGRIFQRLIADRKYLATFYTLPSSAALIARLAIDRLGVESWSDVDKIAELRVGDFACGTGALLAAIHEQIVMKHENAGGKSQDVHKVLMEDVLYGFDVMPSAVHISGATLSGVFPNVRYEGSRLYNMPFGRQSDGTVAIGSLEFLRSSSVMTQINTNDPARRTGSRGEETATNVIADAPDESFDLVIMNPPFTRATNHEGAHRDVTNPAFAAFGATKADQRAMGTRMNELGKNTCYDGNAGIASAFAALGHKKLKPGGVLALVLPLSAAGGVAWAKFRRMIATRYSDLAVFSIASYGKEMAFSSDTKMADCLVVGRKISDNSISTQIRFTSLSNRPRDIVDAHATSNVFRNSRRIRTVDSGSWGGTRLDLGDDLAGETLSSEHDESGGIWGCVRTADYTLSQVAYALERSRLLLPGVSENHRLPTIALGRIAAFGPVDRDITGTPPRGPFDKSKWRSHATYTSIWNHVAGKENRLVCKPDAQLTVRIGLEEKAARIWQSASRSHFNSEFTFGSQALSSAFTEEKVLGGRVWPSVIFEDPVYDFTFSVWCNSTLGLLLYWWRSNRQQSSKATLKLSAAPELPVLDFRALTVQQRDIAKDIFAQFQDLDLMPAYVADADPNRQLLDQRVICDLLGFDNDTFRAVRRLTEKWCAEPSVHGGKKRPNLPKLQA